MRQLILLVMVTAVWLVTQLPLKPVHTGEIYDNAAALTALGLLLLVGFLAGTVTTRIGVPRVTGYMLTGVLIGPFVLNIFPSELVERLDLISDIALVLIALTAGGELRLNELGGRWKTISAILAGQALVILTLSAAAILLFGGRLFPGTAFSPLQAIIVALTLSALTTANSPAVAVAVVAETRSTGPLTNLIMAVTIAVDVLVVVLFTLSISLADRFMASGGSGADAVHASLPVALVGSLLLGGICGVLLILYLRFIGRHLEIILLIMAIFLIRIIHVTGLELLLTAMAIGFVVENYSKQGLTFIKGLERVSPPIYVVFFALAGAVIDLPLLTTIWAATLCWCVMRAAGLYMGTKIGLKIGGESHPASRYAWLGFMPQAGVTLGLTAVVAAKFPQWGGQVQTLILTVVAVNQVIGPVAMRFALQRAGEVGASA